MVMVFSLRNVPIIGQLSTLAQMAAVGLVAGAVGFGLGYLKGGASARQEARIDQLEQSLKAEGVRDGIETDVDALNAYNLCVELGGLPDECRATVRRMETDQQPGQSGTNRSE